jgi:hypothetical protein
MLIPMRIESKGIVISEIFKTDRGERIEIDANGKKVALYLDGDGDTLQAIALSREEFRELLSAMNAADKKINEIEYPTESAR